MNYTVMKHALCCKMVGWFVLIMTYLAQYDGTDHTGQTMLLLAQRVQRRWSQGGLLRN